LSLVLLACGAFIVTALFPDGDEPPAWLQALSTLGPGTGLPATTQSFILGGVALGGVLVSSRNTTPRVFGQVLVALAAVMAAFVLTAFAYGDRDLLKFPFGMGVPGAAGTLLAAAAVFFARPQDPLLRPLVSADLGGEVLRWLVPMALLVPAGLVGAVRVQDAFNTPATLSLIAVSFTVVLLGGLLYASRRVDLYAARGRVAENEASRATDALKQVAPVVSDLVEVLNAASIDRAGKVSVSTRHVPATGLLAGDSLAVFMVRDETIGIVMVDAAGHGAGPALHSLRLRDALSHSLRRGASPATAIGEVKWLFDAVETTATAAVALVDCETGIVTYSLAGHPPPFVDRKGNLSQEAPGGSLLHARTEGGWTDRTVPLALGEHMVLFTDGVADVFEDDNGDDFEALASFLRHVGPRSPGELADACVDFATERRRTDDAAVVVITHTR